LHDSPLCPQASILGSIQYLWRAVTDRQWNTLSTAVLLYDSLVDYEHDITYCDPQILLQILLLLSGFFIIQHRFIA